MKYYVVSIYLALQAPVPEHMPVDYCAIIYNTVAAYEAPQDVVDVSCDAAWMESKPEEGWR